MVENIRGFAAFYIKGINIQRGIQVFDNVSQISYRIIFNTFSN